MSKGEELQVAKVETFKLLQTTPTLLRDVILTNLGNESVSIVDLDKVTIPTGGVISWTVPSLSGEEQVKELEGIIVYWRNSRTFYREAFGEGGGRPECTSDDGCTGIGEPGGDCSRCQLSQFGSDLKGGKGKACRETKALFLIRQNSILPLVIVLSPTSLPGAKAYLLRLTSALVPHYAVTTKITLERTKNEGGIAYSVAILGLGEKLTEEQASKVRAYQELLIPLLSKVKISDVPEEEKEEVSPF